MNFHLPRLMLLIATGFILTACIHADSTTATKPIEASSRLSAYHWHFAKALNADGNNDTQWQHPQHPEQAIKLVFADDSIGITGLCNAMGAGYELTHSKIHISNVISTQRYCSNKALMDLEQSFSRRLPAVVTWQIEQNPAAPKLILGFDDGAQWILEGEASAETKYGNAAEIVFLEVAPQTKACTHPLLGDTQCLQTRTVEFNDQGLKQGHGDWQHFYQGIEHYEHTPGVRNVLRLKHYKDNNATDELSKDVYILDMVVESELMN